MLRLQTLQTLIVYNIYYTDPQLMTSSKPHPCIISQTM